MVDKRVLPMGLLRWVERERFWWAGWQMLEERERHLADQRFRWGEVVCLGGWRERQLGDGRLSSIIYIC